MQTSVTNRPRLVTATVTKPSWMVAQIQDDVRKVRSKSVESNGSTASLTSLLDHDSYDSTSDIEGGESGKIFDTTYTHSGDETREHDQQKPITGPEDRVQRGRRIRSKSSNEHLSAWESWLVEKAKSEQQKKHKERLKKKQEQADKEKKEQEKRARILKAEATRNVWLQRKNEELNIQKNIERLRIEEEKRKKDEIEAQVKQRAAEKFENWQKLKKEEEKERLKKGKEENEERKRLKLQRKLAAEEKFHQWLKEAHGRPKTASNSFGYLSSKTTEYHDCTAYPEPAFYNPIPWQPTVVPSSEKTEKTNKMKPYKWNPDKYL